MQATQRKLRVALVGTRGVTAKYGGSETAAEQVYPRLAARGHEAVVYCRRHMVDPHMRWWNGVRTIVLPSVNTKALDTMSHSFLAWMDMWLNDRADIAHVHGIGNAALFPLFRMTGKRVVGCVDGMDWTRAKWSRLEQVYLRLALDLVVRWSDAVYVDSLAAQRLCRDLYGREFPVVAYGAERREHVGTDLLADFGVSPERYLLFVGRLIPEKGVHYLIDACKAVESELPLVIVGDNPYHPDYVAGLRERADERVRFVGPVFGDAFWQLTSHCYLYVQPSEVEGTSPMLLTAMGQGRCVVVNGIEENLDVIADAGVAFHRNDAGDLAWVLQSLLGRPEVVADLGRAARVRVREEYDWDTIADLHEELFLSVAP